MDAPHRASPTTSPPPAPDSAMRADRIPRLGLEGYELLAAFRLVLEPRHRDGRLISWQPSRDYATWCQDKLLRRLFRTPSLDKSAICRYRPRRMQVFGTHLCVPDGQYIQDLASVVRRKSQPVEKQTLGPVDNPRGVEKQDQNSAKTAHPAPEAGSVGSAMQFFNRL